MVWAVILVRNGVAENVLWLEDEDSAKEEYERLMEDIDTSVNDGSLFEFEDMEIGDTIEVFCKGGYVRDARVEPEEESEKWESKNEDEHINRFKLTETNLEKNIWDN